MRCCAALYGAWNTHVTVTQSTSPRWRTYPRVISYGGAAAVVRGRGRGGRRRGYAVVTCRVRHPVM
jgi:hypothetical protein